jgi:hypothetical protein
MQQRSAELLTQFRVDVPSLDREKAIHEGAASEIAAQKQKIDTKSSTNTSGVDKAQGAQNKKRR